MEKQTIIDSIWFYLGLYDLEQSPINKLNALMTALGLFSTLVVREGYPETKILMINYKDIKTLRGPEIRQIISIRPANRKWVLFRFIPTAHDIILAATAQPTTIELAKAEAIKFVLVQLLTAANWLGDTTKAFEKVMEHLED